MDLVSAILTLFLVIDPLGNMPLFLSYLVHVDPRRRLVALFQPHLYSRTRDFARELGRALHRPSFMPAPGFALRLAFGEMADEVLLGGQRVVPSRLQAEGFSFVHPHLRESLETILR